jgi:hypothetical protein
MPWEVNKIIEIRFDENVRQKGYVYYRSGDPSYLPAGDGYYESPMTVWDVTDKANPRQISFALVEWEGSPANNFMFDPTFNPGDREYLFLIDIPYSETPKPEWIAPDFRFTAPNTFDIPIVYGMWCIQNDNGDGSSTPWQNGDIWRWSPVFPFDARDVFTFSTTAVTYTADAAREDITDIQVFPNPYLGSNEQELNKYQRFVTFNHLPPRANFRIYTVSGTLVRSFSKEDDGTQLATWDLQNDNGLPVASGMYIIHIDMPDLGTEKVLKLGVVSEAQYLDRI